MTTGRSLDSIDGQALDGLDHLFVDSGIKSSGRGTRSGGHRPPDIMDRGLTRYRSGPFASEIYTQDVRNTRLAPLRVPKLPIHAREISANTRFGAMPAPMKICILGATGLVGDELLTLIDRAWPDAKLVLFASRARTIERHGKSYEVLAASVLETENAPTGDLAFVALDDEYSKLYCPRLLELGWRVIDKSNTYRMDPKIVLGVGGVNHDLITDEVRLVANPNCTTIPFTLATQPLLTRWGLESATISSYQAISGAGGGTLDAFIANSAKGYAQGDRIGSNFDPKLYAGNCVPHNGSTDESGFSSEERKLMNESRKILRASNCAVSAQCCRVPVAVGHYENIWLTLKEAPAPGELERALDGAPFVRYLPGAAGEGLSALATVHARDLALVGRVRKDARDASGRSWCLTVAADNLRLGAATNAVRLASCWFGGKDQELSVAPTGHG